MSSTFWGSKQWVWVGGGAADEALGADLLPASHPITALSQRGPACPDTPVASKEMVEKP